jgi:hypothetical protein
VSGRTPSDSNVTFLLCEQVRVEQGGKSSLMGFFPAAEMLVPDTAETITLPSLALYFVMVGPEEGNYTTSVTLLLPSSKVLFADVPLPNGVKQANRPLSIACHVVPFQSPESGTFTTILKLDDASYRRSFSIQKAPASYFVQR